VNVVVSLVDELRLVPLVVVVVKVPDSVAVNVVVPLVVVVE
jgi:hypothetical protein